MPRDLEGPVRISCSIVIEHKEHMANAKAELRVDGLAGPGLPSTVEELLSAVHGVEYVHVNLGAAKVAITYDDSLTSSEAFIAKLKRAGFEATQA